MLATEMAKWQSTVAIALSRFMAYKIDFLLTLIAPSLVFVAINYLVWEAIYLSTTGDSIGSISRNSMLQYQCWSFIVTLLSRSHRSWNLSEDIRHGRITAFLLYPFECWKFQASEFISFQCIQLAIATIAVLTLIFTGFLPFNSYYALATGIAFSLLLSTLIFIIEFILGL